MELKIYNQTGDLKLTVSPNTSSTVTEEVMGECAVSVGFTHTEFVMLDVNDYIDIEGVRYMIMAQYRPKQKNTQTYEYSVKFYAPIHQAENALMLFTPDNEMTSEFAYDGGPREHLQLWIDNMNRTAGTDVWKIGTVITAENKVIEYKNVKCWDAAFGSNGIAAAFNTEMWADGYYINLCKAERGERVDLGYLQGLTSLQQEENGEVKFFTRLFPLGSTRNIDASKYGHARLQLPGGVQYVDKNVDIYGVKEEFEEEAFSEIYPKYIGTVQSVRTENLTNTEGRDYTVYYIKDAAIPFNPNDYEIAEFTKMIAFQSGELAGRGDEKGNFQANWHEDTKEWEIINTYPDDDTQIPGGLIIPKPGDTYIPWNFRMPDEYNTLAEQEYLAAVNNYLDEYSFDTNKYSGQTDRNHIENNSIKLMIGLNVRLQSDTYFAAGYKDTRITKVVRQLNDLYQATVTCTDKIGEGWKKSVDNSINSLKYEVAKSLEQTVIDVIKTGDNKTPSDYNVFSALKSLATLLRKDKPDFTNFLVKFFDGVELGKFVTGMIGGTGGRIDKDGRGEMNSLTLREELIVPKITFNCIDVISGDKANTFAYGTIKNVDKVNMTAELDLLEDERGTLHVNDICRGVFHNIEGGNATEIDTIDDNDFYNYAGFSTSYFTPTKIIENAAGKMKFKYALQVGTTVHPMNGMNFFAYGNFTDKQRQAITYETRYYTRRLKNVNTWKIYPTKNISMQDGLLEGLTIGGMEMHGYGTFQENCYFTGVQIQFTPEQEDQFKGEDAYSCNLSTNNAVVKVDRDGNVLSSMVADYNVISGTKNVITGDRNVITNMYAISSLIQAFKGKQELFYSEVYSEGGYTVDINPQSCTAVIDAGVLSIESIDKDSDKAQVDLQINCEGSVILSQSFYIIKVMDGLSAYIADFDNNVIPLACNTDGKVLIGLPATTTLSVYQDDKKVAMSSVELDLPDGVQATATNDGVVTVTAVPDTSAENLTVKATAKFIAYGTNYEKSASFSLIKVVQGDTPVIYELKPSANAIVFDNAETYTPAKVSCVLTKNDGKTITQITTLPEGYTLKYSKDGGSETNYSIGSAVAVSGIEKSIAFKLYKGLTLVDMEDIPLIKDGVSYIGTDEYFQWGNSATVAPTGEWTLNAVPDPPSDTTYRYLWNYEVVKKSDGTTYTTDKHVMSADGKGIKSVVDYYMLTATADEPSESSSSWTTDKKVTTSDLPYLWNKEVITFTDDTVKVRIRQLAQRGEDGESAIMIDLDNEIIPLPSKNDGTVVAGLPATSNINVYYGSKEITITDIDVVAPSGVVASGDLSGAVTITSVGKTVADSFNIDITVSFNIGTFSHIRKGVLHVNKVRAGADGVTPVIYELSTSASVISRKTDGTNNPSSISCQLIKRDGNNLTSESIVPSGHYLKYRIDNGTESSYSIGSNISASSITNSITFMLYKGSTLVDSENVPIVRDGEKGEQGVPGKPGQDGTDGKPGQDGADGESAVTLIPSVNTIGLTMTGSYEPSAFDVKCYKGSTLHVAYIMCWGSNDGSTYTYIKDTQSYSLGVYVSSTPYKQYVVRVFNYRPSTSFNSATNYLASCSVNVVTDGKDGQDGAPGKDGQDGERGATGSQPRYRGLYSSSQTYVYDSEYRDIVIYNNNAYVVKVFGYSGSATPTNTVYWEQANKYSFVAMDTALIDGANIAGFMYKNEQMQSSSTYLGEPNLVLDGRNGNIKVRGNGSLELRANSGNYFNFTPSVGSLKFYDSSGRDLITLGMGGSSSWLQLKQGGNTSFMTGSTISLEDAYGAKLTLGNNIVSITYGTKQVTITRDNIIVQDSDNSVIVSDGDVTITDATGNLAKLSSTELYFSKTGHKYN